MKKLSLCLFLILVLLWGCTPEPGQTEPPLGNVETAPAASIDTTDLFSDRDYRVSYEEADSVTITLSGKTASCTSSAVTVSGSVVTITGEGTYILEGTLDDGSIVVDMDKQDKAQLVLNGVSIHSQTSAPIYIRQGDKVFVTTAENTENRLSNGGSFTPDGETNLDAVIFSREDLTLNGLGKLRISSPGGHGIVSKDELTLTGGTYEITAGSHGLTGKDNVCIAHGSLTIEAGKDGIHAENSDDESLGFIYIEQGDFHITAENDGISAQSSLEIAGGSFDLLCGGGSANGETHADNFGHPGSFNPFGDQASQQEESTESKKGIKCSGNLILSGGNFSVDSADDAIHSNCSIRLSGGSFHLSTGDDGIHADETLTVTQGSIHVSQSYEGLEALDVRISGGDIQLQATDDGINAAGGADSSGFGGIFGGDAFGGPGGNPPPGVHGGQGGQGGTPPTGGQGGQGGQGGTPPTGGQGSPGGAGMSSGNGSIVISGGTVSIHASGDGIDANGSLEITGGFVTVCGPTRGDTATLDYDTTATISGGTFIGTGASGMAQSFSDSSQAVFAVSVGAQSAGTAITLADASGKVLISHTPELDFSVVILSCPEMVKGETYTITVGGSTGSFAAK